MKSASSELATHMAQENTTLTRLLKIVRTDGVILCLTDFDQNISYAGDQYQAADGLTISAIEYKDDGSPNNVQVTGFLVTTEPAVPMNLLQLENGFIFLLENGDLTLLE